MKYYAYGLPVKVIGWGTTAAWVEFSNGSRLWVPLGALVEVE